MLTSVVVRAGAMGAIPALDERVVTFDGPNRTGWTFLSLPYTHVEPGGGNPGAYLSGRCRPGGDCVTLVGVRLLSDTFLDSDFTGDYRARAVSSLGFDGILFDVSEPIPETPTSLILYSDRSTPFDSSDDLFVYTLGPTAPQVGEGWQSYDFQIPADSPTLPPDWLVQDGAPLDGDEARNAVITDVSHVQFYWNQPNALFLPPRLFDPGADDVRITFEEPGPPPCYADCDENGDFDVLDFVCFQSLFSEGCR